MRGKLGHLNVKICQNSNSYSFYQNFMSKWSSLNHLLFHDFIWMSKYSPSYGLLIRVKRSWPISLIESFKSCLGNYWEQLNWNLNLKFLWNVALYVSFLTKLVSLKLKLYRASYALYNKLQKIISHSILIQWPYNLYGWKALNI